MGIEDGSTLRWTKARERNRLKARYLIRSSVISRVVDDVDVDDKAAKQTTTTNGCDNNDVATLPSSASPGSAEIDNSSIRRCHNHSANHDYNLPASSSPINYCQDDNSEHTRNELSIIRQFLERIIQNDVSFFSVAALAKHGKILERLPILLLPTATATTTKDAASTFTNVAPVSTYAIDFNTITTTSTFSIINQRQRILTEMMSTILPWEMSDLQQRQHQPHPPQPTTLATSKYGRDYVSHRLLPYMQQIQQIRRRTLTVLEYASLLGRHDIVSMLLLGGMDPTFLPEARVSSDDKENVTTSSSSSSSNEASRSVLGLLHNVPHGNKIIENEHEDNVGVLCDGGVLQEECCCSRIPLSMWAYIVRAVIDMRMNGILKDVSSQEEGPPSTINTNGKKVNDATRSCYCMKCNNNNKHHRHHQGVKTTLLLFGPPCYHYFCEPCMWKHLVRHVPNCTNLKNNVVTCPICEDEFRGLNMMMCHDNASSEKTEEKQADGYSAQQLSLLGSDELAVATSSAIGDSDSRQRRQLRCSESLTKFLKLPATCTELKLSNKAKRKKKKRRDYAHGTWEDALHASMTTMQSQSVRSDRFFKAVLSSPQLVAAYLDAGVNVNMQNIYGQTPLYLACWKGSISVVRSLLDFGANVDIAANGGSTCYSIAKRRRRIEVLHLLEENSRIMHGCTIPRTFVRETTTNKLSSLSSEIRQCQVSILINPADDHPGAGACIVDDALSDTELKRLENLWKSLPVSDASTDEAINEKNNAVSSSSTPIQDGQSKSDIGENKSAYRPSRYYFCDAEEWVQTMLEECVDAVRIALLATKDTVRREASYAPSTGSSIRPSPPTSIFQHIRFLNYERPGGILPPHVDLCRVDSASGLRSTHTFILYLTDCGEGGGTALLHQLKDPRVMSVVQPKRGRALIFPHICPHSGLEVVRAPKLLMRGEIMLNLHCNP